MKKIIAALIAVSMIATPALARERGGHDRGYERHERHSRGIRTGEAVAIGLGALILGAAISKNNRNTRVVERYEYRDYRRQPQYVCQDVVQYDYYGNPYVAGRNCWYQ
jgi:hypothetical protein